MTRLRDLDPQFIRREIHVESYRRMRPGVSSSRLADDDLEWFTGPRVYLVPVLSLADAHGISFLCPKCFAENRGPVGTHLVVCWFHGKVPGDADPKPGRWNPVGTGYDDLSFVPGHGKSNSVLLLGGCRWHGFITNGDVSCSD